MLSLTRILICMALIFGFGLNCSFAQGGSEAAKIDELMTYLEKENKFMGSLTLTRNGEPIFSKAYGIIGEQAGEPVLATTTSKYRVGSISKMFTSVLILQMVESQKLALDDKLSKFFPEIKNADSITIDQMLRHRSGIGSITDDPEYLTWNVNRMSRVQLMEKVAAQSSKFDPGEKTEYSNSNFILLGFMLEELSGKTYAELLQEKICQPLQLKNTYYGKKAVVTEGEAISYKFDGEQWQPEPETDMSIPHGAGAVVASMEDLTTFVNALFAGKLINDESLGSMKDMSGGLGQGLMTFPFGSKKAFGHFGGIDGFLSNLAYFPEEKLAIAISGNGVDYTFNEILIGILSRAFSKPHELPEFSQVAVDVDRLNQYTGVYSTEGFPLKITIAVDGKRLTGQASGQPAFKLEATSETEFTFNPAGVKIEFVPTENGEKYDMKFQQGAANMTFTSEAAAKPESAR